MFRRRNRQRTQSLSVSLGDDQSQPGTSTTINNFQTNIREFFSSSNRNRNQSSDEPLLDSAQIDNDMQSSENSNANESANRNLTSNLSDEHIDKEKGDQNQKSDETASLDVSKDQKGTEASSSDVKDHDDSNLPQSSSIDRADHSSQNLSIQVVQVVESLVPSSGVNSCDESTVIEIPVSDEEPLL